MNICLHTIWEIEEGFIGGTERFLIELSKELKNFGANPIIVCTGQKGDTNIDGIHVHRCIDPRYTYSYQKYSGMNLDFILNEIIGQNYTTDSLQRLADFVLYQISSVKADVYHLNSFASAAKLQPFAPTIVTNHENNLEYDFYWGEGFYNHLASLIKSKKTHLQKYFKLITPSLYYAKQFSKDFSIDIDYVHLGVCLENFPTRIKKISKNYAKIEVLLPSRFSTYQKGHDIALQAARILKDQDIPTRFTFSGARSDYSKEIEKFWAMATELKIGDIVRVKKYIDIQDAYNECDLVISPERYCSYGLSISEALSLGIPTVLNAIPTYKEIASGYGTAYFFDENSPSDLAAKIIIASNSSHKKQAALDSIRFRIQYDMRECAKKYIGIYMQAIQNNNTLS